jgi:hypothetical protein
MILVAIKTASAALSPTPPLKKARSAHAPRNIDQRRIGISANDRFAPEAVVRGVGDADLPTENLDE